MLRWFPCVAALAFALPTFAATPVYVDGTGACAGLTPCFTTIQAGVNNAGPPPAIVNVFPGDYDSVDVGLMGSAIGGSTGDLTLRTVDADGDPALGTARILPATGEAIINSASPFMGDLFIRGFTVKSPDDDGIVLLMIQGTVELRGVVSDENDGGGFRTTILDGDLRAIDSSFSGNLGGDGLVATVNGDLDFERVTASGNSSDGAVLTVGADVLLRDSHFDDNDDDGLVLTAGGGLDVDGSSFDRNGSDGAVVTVGGGARVHQSTFDDNDDDGFVLTAGGDLDVEASSFDRNKSDGAVATVGGNARIHQSTFDDNRDDGFVLTAGGDLDVDGSSFDRNSSDGAVVSAGGDVRIHQSTFDDNRSGDGLSLSADGRLDIEGSTFDRNRSDGAVLGADGAVAVRDSSFSGNMGGEGLNSFNDHPFEATRIVANDNGRHGLAVYASSARISASRFEDNGGAGVQLGSDSGAGPYVLRCNDIAGNGDGLLVPTNITVVAESNFWGSPSGPTHPSNPGGTGDTVRDAAFGAAGTVDFEPFLIKSAAESGQCSAHPAPALDWTGLAILSLALFVLPARRLMRVRAGASV